MELSIQDLLNKAKKELDSQSNTRIAPIGRFSVEAEDTVVKTSPSSGNEYIEIKVKFVSEGFFKGRVMWARLHFTPATLERSFKDLVTIGVDAAAVGRDASLSDIAAMIPGNQFDIQVKMGEARGGYDARPEVAWINRLSKQGERLDIEWYRANLDSAEFTSLFESNDSPLLAGKTTATSGPSDIPKPKPKVSVPGSNASGPPTASWRTAV
jgi:hypothetical protein